jgi:hypothetical protein
MRDGQCLFATLVMLEHVDRHLAVSELRNLKHQPAYARRKRTLPTPIAVTYPFLSSPLGFSLHVLNGLRLQRLAEHGFKQIG